MSFEPPEGILDIGNATLRVGKLEVAETSGLNQGLLNIVKNNLLITENTEYSINHHWGIKLPTTWVADFDVKGHSGKYVEFNFYNEDKTSNTSGYTLNFKDTSLTLKYDNGTTLASATIPTIVGAYRKVNIFFERNVIAVSIDGTRYLYDKRPSVLSRVISTTGSAFVNVFIESDNENNSKFKNLRIVNGRFISDQTSNIAFIGGNLGVGVNSPTESLDVLGNIKSSANLHVSGNVHTGGEIELYSNLNIQQVSNTATIKATSNVVAEFPRSKKLIKYPRVALTQNALNNGYTVIQSGTNGNEHRKAWSLFNNDVTTDDQYHAVPNSGAGESNPYNPSGGAYDPDAGFEDGLGDVAGEYVYVVMPDKIKLQGVSVHPRDGVLARSAESARFMGSNNGTTWVDLGGYIDYHWPTGSQEPGAFFHVDSNEYYNYIGVVWTKVNGGSGGDTVNMAEVQFYGTPEYDPEAHGTDVTVKSYPNVPNTDWLEVYYDAKNYSGSGDVQDETTNNIDATIGAATTFDSVNKAWSFSGTSNRDGSEFVSGYLPSDFQGNQAHSVSMWLKFDYWHDGSFCIIGKQNRTNNDDDKAIHFQLHGTSSTTPRILYDFWGNQKRFYLPESIQPGKWFHMTSVYTAEHSVASTGYGRRMFVNGQELLKFDESGDMYTALNLDTSNDLVVRLGTRYPVSSSNNFHGDIANFRLFNRAVTSDEIYQLYAYQKEDFGHGDLSMTLKAGRLGIGTSEPRAALDVNGRSIYVQDGQIWPIPTAIFSNVTPSNTGSAYYQHNIGTQWVYYNKIVCADPSGTILSPPLHSREIVLTRTGLYEFQTISSIQLQSGSAHMGLYIQNLGIAGSLYYPAQDGYEVTSNHYNTVKKIDKVHHIIVRVAPAVVGYYMQPASNSSNYYKELAYGNNNGLHSVRVKYLG